MKERTRGRPRMQIGAREAILEAARRQFAELGYRTTTLRHIASAAGVDARLVQHYFGSKRQLFMETVELPLDPTELIERVFAGNVRDVGRRVAMELIALIDEPSAGRSMAGLIRAAASEPEAAELIREILTRRILVPLADRVGGDRPDLRAAMVASQVVGIVMARRIVGLTALAEAPREVIVEALAPVIEHYLRDPWVPPAQEIVVAPT
jgi:AcrR family transcriptional regulator